MGYTVCKSSDDIAVDTATAQAIAYVWGRQDAGESARDTGYSVEFGNAYGARKAAYLRGDTGMMPNIQAAFEQWSKTGQIA